MKNTLVAACLCLSTSAFASPKVISYFTPSLSMDSSRPGRVSVVTKKSGYNVIVTMPKANDQVGASVTVKSAGTQVELSKAMKNKLGYATTSIFVPAAITKVNGPGTLSVKINGMNSYTVVNDYKL